MTRHQYQKNIEQELRKLNERIDYKILHGIRYVEDSIRHKQLRQKIKKQKTNTFFGNLIPSLLKL